MKNAVQSLIIVFISLFFSYSSLGQLEDYEFGNGFRYSNPDKTFSIKSSFRFQSLYSADWSIRNDDFSKVEDVNSQFLIRRSRLKFSGNILLPNLRYKFELGLSNRDINTGTATEFGGGSNILYDAYFDWNFHKGFSLLVGQAKLPGNRERVISSGSLQFVDRSYLNSRFNLDRDMGMQLSHQSDLGKKGNLKMILAISQGEGRDVIVDNIGGLEYTYHLEYAPFGSFKSKGNFFSADLLREQTPKLSIGATFDLNDKAGRTRGNLGSFLSADSIIRKTLYTGFVDFIFKYRGFSMMGEFAVRAADGNNSNAYYENGDVADTYFTGTALNLNAGYLLKNNYEFALRYTKLRTSSSAVGYDQSQYFVGFSKYVKNHNLKIQTDFGFQDVVGADNGLICRLQFEFQL